MVKGKVMLWGTCNAPSWGPSVGICVFLMLAETPARGVAGVEGRGQSLRSPDVRWAGVLVLALGSPPGSSQYGSPAVAAVQGWTATGGVTNWPLREMKR